ncbi:cgr1 [Acrasis kona]|uniref:Cgr1 n=1 Tax=Acrasis kona TaxID=1008807 RepID=A0AAW2Z3A5_9EUKA
MVSSTPADNTTNDTVKNNQKEVQGVPVSGRIWKKPRKRFSSNYVKSTGTQESVEVRMEKKRKLQEMKDLNKKLNDDVKAERAEQIRAIKQRKQAKLENQIKAGLHKPLSQKKKSNGRNQSLSVKDWKKVKSGRDFSMGVDDL